MRLRSRWVLLAAFALSLIVHAVLAIFVHPPRPQPQTEAIIAMRRVKIVRVVPTPRPAPPPKSLPRRTPVTPPHVISNEKRGVPAIHPQGIATATPGARPSPPPSPTPCAGQDESATVVATPSPPEISPAVRALDVSGIAAVLVQLDKSGNVTGVSIAQSTGDASFDALAVSMAREASYTPARHGCTAIAATYLFKVQFYAW
jgi:TonB family protein